MVTKKACLNTWSRSSKALIRWVFWNLKMRYNFLAITTMWKEESWNNCTLALISHDDFIWKYYSHKASLFTISTSGSESNDAVVTSTLTLIWSHVTALAGSNLTPLLQMIFATNAQHSWIFMPACMQNLCAQSAWVLYTWFICQAYSMVGQYIATIRGSGLHMLKMTNVHNKSIVTWLFIH